MKKIEAWPPPNWFEVVIPWEKILLEHINPHKYYDWCDEHTSKNYYHVHGWKQTEGFAFRFEDKNDGLMFLLKWK